MKTGNEGDECVTASQTQEDPRVTWLLVHSEWRIQAPGGGDPGCRPEVALRMTSSEECILGYTRNKLQEVHLLVFNF